MVKLILVFLVLFMMSSQVYAEWMIYGWGKETCGHYVKVLEGQRRGDKDNTLEYFVFMSWFYGFASCVSATKKQEVLRGSDMDAHTLWLEKYCREHPLDNFFGASVELMNFLKNK